MNLNKAKFENIFYQEVIRGSKEDAQKIISKNFPGHKIYVDQDGFAKVTRKEKIVAVFGTYKNQGSVLVFMN